MELKAKPAPEPSPGTMLREAREERRLSIDDVAQALRLAPRLIGAIEEDAYDRLPGPTYVRGYLRSYAQFLGLPPQRLIDAFNARPEAAQRTDMVAPAPVRQATSSDAAVRFATVVVVVLVLGLVVLWWQGQQPAPPEQPSSAEVAAPAEEAPAASEAPTAGAAPAPSAEAERDAAPEQAVVETAPASATPAPAAPRAAVPPPDPGVPLSRLVLYVHADSWVDVRDAQQRRLLYETVPAGRVVTVEGVPPISVFLGNVGGVTVEFDGKPYDALRHRRGDVARFTLGAPRG